MKTSLLLILTLFVANSFAKPLNLFSCKSVDKKYEVYVGAIRFQDTGWCEDYEVVVTIDNRETNEFEIKGFVARYNTCVKAPMLTGYPKSHKISSFGISEYRVRQNKINFTDGSEVLLECDFLL